MLGDNELKTILTLLSKSYPNPRPELEFSSPFELLVATILSAQTTDKQVNRCTRVLFSLYNTPQQLSLMDENLLFPYIKTCGLYQTKGRNIIAMSKLLLERHGGEVPCTREELTSLPGVGRKTANVVLSNAFNIPAIAVDTHVFRVANRIGITDAKDVKRTEEQLMLRIPERDWGDAHHWLILHGRRVCAARSPRCEVCCINSLCMHTSKEGK